MVTADEEARKRVAAVGTVHRGPSDPGAHHRAWHFCPAAGIVRRPTSPVSMARRPAIWALLAASALVGLSLQAQAQPGPTDCADGASCAQVRGDDDWDGRHARLPGWLELRTAIKIAVAHLVQKSIFHFCVHGKFKQMNVSAIISDYSHVYPLI